MPSENDDRPETRPHVTALRRPRRFGRCGMALVLVQGCGGWNSTPVPAEAGDAGEPAPFDDGEAGAAEAPDGASSGTEDAGFDATDGGVAAMSGLHAVGNHLENGQGEPVVLRGVNRSGTEYKCIQPGGVIFDGPHDEASIEAMVAWNINAVRVPLNEACWLAINGAPESSSGDLYKGAIREYVALLHRYGIVPILDLHWVAPGDAPADRLQPLPDAHAVAFWNDVATTFREDDALIFEPYNEPFPERNTDTSAAWACWRDGCTTPLSAPADAGAPATYEAVGMQALVNAIRSSGATNLILLGGLQYSNALSQWLTYRPSDPIGNLGAAWHVYNNNLCRTPTCWDNLVARVGDVVPLVATEIGENDCDGAFITQVMSWLDARGTGYLAWTWDVYGTGACRPTLAGQQGQPFPLIVDYAGTPKGVYGQTFHDHLIGLAVP